MTRSDLRRDLGSWQAYAALVGILIGAGVFRVTGEAWRVTGSSVILGYALLAIPVVATSVPYMLFLSLPVGSGPGAEYSHIVAAAGRPRLASWAAWLKIVSYIGALAFLAEALADYLVPLLPPGAAQHRLAIAQAALVGFVSVHVAGVRWFGRLQVVMVTVLALSLVLLIVPGLAAIEPGNYAPLFRDGASGFARALPPLFFAYAGFEAVAHAAGEVRNSRAALPRVVLRGIAVTAVVFVAMSVVAFGVLDGEALGRSRAPMYDVAAVYLPGWGAKLVALGALMAICTSLNTTALVPSRLALVLARDGRLPVILGQVHATTGTPVVGLIATLALASALMWSGQLSLALGIAVVALVLVYLIHGIVALGWIRARPELLATAGVRIGSRVFIGATVTSVVALAGLLVAAFAGDAHTLAATALAERWATRSMTTVELIALWSIVGLVVLRERSR